MCKEKISYICKNINTIDIEKKEHICKILLTYDINLIQSNNGAFCSVKDLNDDIINIIYDFIINNLKP